MDIKDLNKPQLILLTVLLSFVTSIATGITTVTLMQEAPVSITAPVNRVIKQTIEKIEQVEGKTTVNTVVVKEEDLVVDAISKNKSSIFSLVKDGFDDNGNLIEISLGKGFVLNQEGVVVTDAFGAMTAENKYHLKNDSGKFKADWLFTEKGISFLKINENPDLENKPVFSVPVFGDFNKAKIGQKIIILGNSISSLIFDGDKNLNISVVKGNSGAVVFNLEAEILGIALFNDLSPFVPIDVINTVYSAKNL